MAMMIHREHSQTPDGEHDRRRNHPIGMIVWQFEETR
jgi:hypothetical protein